MIKSCNLCSLSKNCLSPVLQNNPRICDVLIVCDQPDSKADFEGEAFAGSLGRLLRNLTKTANLTSYQSVYSVKCATPDNGKTLPVSSIDACRIYLKEEITHSRPQYILCMGDVALRSVTRKSGVRNNRGIELSAIPELNTNAKVFCTYSLEYVAKNSNFERTVVSDISRCKKQLIDTNVPWKIWEGEEIYGDIISYDIEAVDTKGLFTDYATQVAVANEEICYVTNDIKAIFDKLGSKLFVGHNSLHYDGPVLRRQGIQVKDYHDSMYMAFFMDETQPRGLESLAVKYLGVPGWKEAFKAKLGSEEFYFYNARDAWYTMKLFQLFKKELSKDKRFYLLENLIYPCRKIFADMTNLGVYLNKDSIYETKKVIGEELNAAKIVVLDEMKKFLSDVEDVNPRSYAQVAKCLNELNVPLNHTEKGNPITSTEEIKAYLHIPFVKKLIYFRDVAHQMSSFINPYLKLSNTGEGRAYPNYNLFTDTGRTSASNPNVQNLDRELKGFFGAETGKVLLSVDYNTIEFRVAAWLSQEKGILDLFAENSKWDPHRYFASVFYDIPEENVTKEQRQIAKSGNFSQLYIGNGFTLWEYAKKRGVNLKLSLCERIHEKWHNTFPGFNNYYEEKKHEILKTGTITCPTGFIRHFGDPELLRQNYGRNFFAKLRQAVNVPVQNLATHISFLAMKRLAEFNFPMVLFVHDSVSFELDDDFTLDNKVKQIEKIMCEWPVKTLKEEYGVELTVPLMVESEIKRNV